MKDLRITNEEIDYMLSLLYERKSYISYAATGLDEEYNQEYQTNLSLRINLENLKGGQLI